MHLQGYDFEIVHTKGKFNPSGFLSRHSNTSTDEKQDVLAEDYANVLTSHAVPKAMTLTEIQQAMLEDTTLQSLIANVESPTTMLKSVFPSQIPKEIGAIRSSVKCSKEQKHVSVKSQNELPETSSGSNDDYLYTLGQGKTKAKTPVVSVKINNATVEMIVDTGASIDILDEKTYGKVNHLKDIKLQTTTKRLFAYGSEPQLEVIGKFEATIEFQKCCRTSIIHVLRGNHGSLLSYRTAVNLGVVDITVNKVNHKPQKHEQLMQQYPSLFKGIGKLKGVQVKLHIDKKVNPVAQPPRRIPFHLRKKVEKELEHLEEQGIIEKVEDPTPWVSPLVIIPKRNNDIRLCVDMRMANKAMRGSVSQLQLLMT